MNRLGSTIKQLRLQKGLTEKQLAKKLGVSESYIIEVEQGRKIMGEALAARVNKLLGATIDSDEATYYSNSSASDSKPATPKPLAKPAAKPSKQDEEPSPVWEQAMHSIIADIPVYSEIVDARSLEKAPESVQRLVMDGSKVLGYAPAQVFAYKYAADDMCSYRIAGGDLLFLHRTDSWEGTGVYLVIEDGNVSLRHIADSANGVCVTYCKTVNGYPSPVSYILPTDRIKPLGKVIRILIKTV